METRISSKKDKEVIKELWENSGVYSSDFTEWYFENMFLPENTVISAEEGTPMATFAVVPQKLRISGYEAETAYISGINILPEYKSREKNVIGDMMIAVKDYLLSVVVPRDYRLFEQCGWRTTYEYKQYNIKPSDIPPYSARGRFLRADINSDTISALSKVYQKFMQDKNAYTLRNKDEWKLILEDLYYNFGGRCVIYYDSDNNPAGYMLMIANCKKLSVYEFAYCDRSAYESMMGFVRGHDVEIAEIKVSANDMGYLDFCNNRSAVSLHTFAMARITDVKKVLGIVASKLEDSFKIQVIDRLVEENNKTFILGGETVETDEEPDVITDIGTLTQMFMGYLGVDDVCRLNLVSGNAALLKKIFGKKSNYINMLLL